MKIIERMTLRQLYYTLVGGKLLPSGSASYERLARCFERPTIIYIGDQDPDGRILFHD